MAIKVQGNIVVDDSRNANVANITVLGTLTTNGTTGTPGQVLQSTGSGLIWQTPSSGSSLTDFASYELTNNQKNIINNLQAVALTGKFDNLTGNITATQTTTSTLNATTAGLTNLTVSGTFTDGNSSTGGPNGILTSDGSKTVWTQTSTIVPSIPSVYGMVTDLLDASNIIGGNAFACGYGSIGQLGQGNTNNYSSPVQIGALTNWKQIDHGQYWSVLAVRTDGTLWAWGSGSNGGLGLGDTTTRSSPVQVGTLTNWKQVSTGFYHSAAIKTDGTLWTWGWNNNGQLGQGNILQYSSPVQVGALTNWKQVSCGGYETAAIKTDGTLWTCGYNVYGQLGLGNSTKYSSPVQVGALTNWKQVSISEYVGAAVKTDGSLWTWGYNGSGQLGQGDTSIRNSPTQVGTKYDWKQVSAGSSNCAAIKTDGTLWTWGYNNVGQLGQGNTNNYSSPVQVGVLTNWKQVSFSRGNNPTCGATKTDGTLWTWGNNNFGQLGQGNTTNRSSPVQVGTLTNWKQISCGYKSIEAINYMQQNSYPVF